MGNRTGKPAAAPMPAAAAGAGANAKPTPEKSGLRVAVIGAGPAGLVSAKVLAEHGHAVVLFEQALTVGGQWTYSEPSPLAPSSCPTDDVAPSAVYAHLTTNLSSHVMRFSDFGFGDAHAFALRQISDRSRAGRAEAKAASTCPDTVTTAASAANASAEVAPDASWVPDSERVYPHHTAVHNYLMAYVMRHGLDTRVRVLRRVTSVTPVVVPPPATRSASAAAASTAGSAAAPAPTTGWWVRSCHTPAPGMRTNGTAGGPNGGDTTEHFDAVAVCNGHFARPFVPPALARGWQVWHAWGRAVQAAIDAPLETESAMAPPRPAPPSPQPTIVLHSASYRTPERVWAMAGHAGTIVVVGDRYSGLDIVLDLLLHQPPPPHGAAAAAAAAAGAGAGASTASTATATAPASRKRIIWSVKGAPRSDPIGRARGLLQGPKYAFGHFAHALAQRQKQQQTAGVAAAAGGGAELDLGDVVAHGVDVHNEISATDGDARTVTFCAPDVHHPNASIDADAGAPSDPNATPNPNGPTIAGVSVILCCTGYEYDFPFLDAAATGVRVAHQKQVVGMFEHVWPTTLRADTAAHQQRDHTLAFIGLPFLVVPFPLMELQATWMARHWLQLQMTAADSASTTTTTTTITGTGTGTCTCALPPLPDMQAWCRDRDARLRELGVPERYTHRVDYYAYATALVSRLNACRCADAGAARGYAVAPAARVPFVLGRDGALRRATAPTAVVAPAAAVAPAPVGGNTTSNASVAQAAGAGAGAGGGVNVSTAGSGAGASAAP